MNACQCDERKKPVRERAWIVYNRRCHYSAFSGYGYTPSDYSAVHCRECNATWRTKARYVDELRDGQL